MFIAMNHTKDFVYASEVKIHGAQTEIFYCPNCFERVFFKKSKNGNAFFSHLTECNQAIQRSKPLETKEHLLGKELILTELKILTNNTVQTELYFSAINQYADVYFETAKPGTQKFIYEFQRSIIPDEDIRLRNDNYMQNVDEVHWFIDFHTTKDLQLNQRWLQTMMNYNKQFGFHLKRLDLMEQRIKLDYNLPIIFNKAQVTYQQMTLKIAEFHKVEQFSQSSIQMLHTHSDGNTKPKNYRKQLNSLMNSPAYRDEVFALYQEGTLLVNLPEWIFTENWQILLTTGPSWLVFAWILTIINKLSNSFSTTEFIEIVRESKQVELAPFLLIKEDLYPLFCRSILVLLMRKKMIHLTQENKWIKINNSSSWSRN